MRHGKSELRGRQIHAEKPNMHRKATSSLFFFPSGKETQSAGSRRLSCAQIHRPEKRHLVNTDGGRDLQPALSQPPIFSDRRMSDSEACTFRSRSVKPSHQSHQTETEANVCVHCWGKRCVMKMAMGSGEMWLAQCSTLFLPSTGLTGSSGLQAVQDKAKSWQFSSWQGGTDTVWHRL